MFSKNASRTASFAFAFTLLGQAFAQNLIPNPGFEDDDTLPCGQGVLPAPWFQAGGLTLGADTYSVDCDVSPGVLPTAFNNFATLTNVAEGVRFVAGASLSGGESIGCLLTSPVVAGQDYTLSGLFTQGTRADMLPGSYAVFLSNAGLLDGSELLVGMIGGTSIENVWTAEELSFTAPSAATSLFLFPVADIPGTLSYVGVDDLALVADAQPPAFVDGCDGDGGDQMGCTDCPCGNNAAPGSSGGCVNSAGASARLTVSGTASVAAVDARFQINGVAPFAACVLTSGASLAPTNAQNPCFGQSSGLATPMLDGLRCVVQSELRHGMRRADDSGNVGITNEGWGTPNGFFQFSAFTVGVTRHFQVVYRDAPGVQCMSGQNTSQAISATFSD